jgi:hypothetical protein
MKATLFLALLIALSGYTQKAQNRLGRAIQNWTGTDGVLEVYAGDKLVKRFLKIDKLTTQITSRDTSRGQSSLSITGS